jgi:hypothetical protein
MTRLPVRRVRKTCSVDDGTRWTHQPCPSLLPAAGATPRPSSHSHFQPSQHDKPPQSDCHVPIAISNSCWCKESLTRKDLRQPREKISRGSLVLKRVWLWDESGNVRRRKNRNQSNSFHICGDMRVRVRTLLLAKLRNFEGVCHRPSCWSSHYCRCCWFRKQKVTYRAEFLAVVQLGGMAHVRVVR